MTPSDPWARARRLAARIRRAPRERDRILAACRERDPGLAKRVEDILDASEQPGCGGLAPDALLHRVHLARAGIRAGVRLGDFRLERMLDSGGSSAVWLARQSAPVERRVAVKLLSSIRRSEVKVMEREARALARLQHPDIAKVFDVGLHPWEEGVIPWIALEYFEGGEPLDRVAAQMDRPEKLLLLERVCHAMAYTHSRGIYHLDLKPANLLARRRQGRVELCIIDFGIADSDGGLLEGQPSAGSSGIGTLPYASPEQLAGESGVARSLKSDVYSLSVVAHRLLTGEFPFAVDGLSPEAASRCVGTEGTTPDLPHLGDSDAAWVCHRGLLRDRDERYASMEALGEDFARLRRGRPVNARPSSHLHSLRLFAVRNRGRLLRGGLAALILAGTFVAHTRYLNRHAEALAGDVGRLEKEVEEHVDERFIAAHKILGEDRLAADRAAFRERALGNETLTPPGRPDSLRLNEIVDTLLAVDPSTPVEAAELRKRIAVAARHNSEGDFEAALELIREEDVELVQAETDGAIQLEVQVRNVLAEGNSKLGRYEVAIAHCERIVDLTPDAPHAYMNLASTQTKAGRIEEAIESYARGRSVDPEGSLFPSEAGNLLEQLGRRDEAVESFTRARDLEPELPRHHFNLGVVLERSGRWEEAAACYGEAMRLAPGDVRPVRSLCTALMRTRSWEEALEPFDQLCELSIGAELGWALLERGQVHERLGDHTAALEDFRASAKLHVDPRLPFEHEARCHFLQGHHSEALEVIDRIVGPGYDRALGLDIQAQSLHKLERWDEAKDAYDRVLEVDPDRWECLWNRCLCKEQLGDIEGALADIETLRKVDPQSDAYRKAEDHLLGISRDLEADRDSHSGS